MNVHFIIIGKLYIYVSWTYWYILQWKMLMLNNIILWMKSHKLKDFTFRENRAKVERLDALLTDIRYIG